MASERLPSPPSPVPSRATGPQAVMPPAAPSGWVHYWIRMLSPGPPSRTSWPGPPISTSSPAPPSSDVVAVAADQHVVAVAAVGRELDRAGRQARGFDHVVAGQGVDRQPVVGGLGAGDVDLGGQAEHGDAARVAGDGIDVVAVGAVDDDGVGLRRRRRRCPEGRPG